MEILFFGSLAEITSSNKMLVDEIVDTDSLKNFLQQKYTDLKTSKYFIAVNQKMIQSNTMLSKEDTIALMPPFSGG